MYSLILTSSYKDFTFYLDFQVAHFQISMDQILLLYLNDKMAGAIYLYLLKSSDGYNHYTMINMEN